MFKTIRVVFAALLLAGLPEQVYAHGSDQTVMVSADDAEMNAAIASARASLPAFWHQYESPSEGVTGPALKVRITDGQQTEYFWLVDIERHGDTFSGVINNDADLVHNVKLGERYAFGAADIADWMYLHNGKMVGNATARVLIKHLPADQAQQYLEMFDKP